MIITTNNYYRLYVIPLRAPQLLECLGRVYLGLAADTMAEEDTMSASIPIMGVREGHSSK